MGTHHDQSVIHVTDPAWLDPVETNEAESPQDWIVRKQCFQRLLIPESVLQCQKACIGADQRRKQVRESMIRGGFKSDDHKITLAYCRGIVVRVRLEMESPIGTFDGHALLPNRVVI